MAGRVSARSPASCPTAENSGVFALAFSGRSARSHDARDGWIDSPSLLSRRVPSEDREQADNLGGKECGGFGVPRHGRRRWRRGLGRSTVMRAESGLLPREKLMKQALYEGMDKELAAKLLDGADSSLRSWSTYKSSFLAPPDVAVMRKLLEPLMDIEVRAWGGYEQAERKRLFFCREGMGGETDIETEVGTLEIGGQFLFDMAEHRDYLGAIVGTGITRDAVGDIIVQGERGAQVLVDPDMSEYLIDSLTSVRTVTVKVRPIPLEELAVGVAKRKEVSTVEASLRLDSVASAGMGMSRSKLSEAIKAGLVLVNWKAASSGTVDVKEGDMITVRGKGRVEVMDISVTKKGRYKINMSRTT